ncbi:hypothetical protein INP51_14815 [Blautia liquoris]|jgi:hypothetical protein|uniref:DUF6440 domain-containing protein n=1 Tax=Blautia liquoris TaxID=2779518 RepID=A0A7M2RG10_9FIRM|nr:DUF6440 family protein [Blautia liquoris]QOV19199.1 hypothetical protein INP51_14815 [Blautia liquoris]
MINKKEKRFVIKGEESFEGGKLVVIVDKETGVNYISYVGLGASALTPLLDEKGNVIAEK